MKNQYFGDINDYRKYGLLRILSGFGEIETAVCWMLTADDGGGDGRKTQYLEEERERKWRHHDPPLYDFLRSAVLDRGVRAVSEIMTEEIFPRTRFFSELLTDNPREREGYFDRFLDQAHGAHLVFFDPDNGMEVPSTRYGTRGSRRYLYWHELKRTYEAGHSILVYQHYPRVDRSEYNANLIAQFQTLTGAPTIHAFPTANVVFFLIPHDSMKEFFERQIEEMEEHWEANQMKSR